MKIYVSLSKRNKKLLKYAILFILASILIYYSNILQVNATSSTTSSTLGITFPAAFTARDNVASFPSISFKSNPSYDETYTSAWVNSESITMTTSGIIIQLPLVLKSGHSYTLYNYWASSKNLMIDMSACPTANRVFGTSLQTGYTDVSVTGMNRYAVESFVSTVSTGANVYVDLPYLSMSYINFTYTGTSNNNRFLYITQMSSSSTTYNANQLAYLGYQIVDNTTLTTSQNQKLNEIQDTLEEVQGALSSIDLTDVNSKLNQIQEEQEATADAIDDQIQQDKEQHEETMDTITGTDTSGADDEASGFFNDFESNDFGLSDIITLPLTTIQSITSKSCTPLSLTLPFVNKTFQLPCMTTIYSKFEPFYSIYQTITFGVISYWVCVQIYAMVKNFKDPAKDEIEVMDL